MDFPGICRFFLATTHSANEVTRSFCRKKSNTVALRWGFVGVLIPIQHLSPWATPEQKRVQPGDIQVMSYVPSTSLQCLGSAYPRQALGDQCISALLKGCIVNITVQRGTQWEERRKDQGGKKGKVQDMIYRKAAVVVILPGDSLIG